MAQILMPDKEYLTYRGMLEGLRQHLPRFRPRLMHMDYERNPIRAWREVYRANVRGCYFHYVKVNILINLLSYLSCMGHSHSIVFPYVTQADLKNVRRLGLTNLMATDRHVRSLLRCFLSIPLLPHDMMHRGLIILIRRALRLAQFDALVPFLMYYIKTWMVGYRYETLSVFHQANRTNNGSETAQRNLRKETGPHHPNIWQFISEFQ